MPCDIILIQNPPSIPAAVASIILSFFSGSIVCIDWHNLGFSMFAERLGTSHLLVQLVKRIEQVTSYFIPYHICVSRAMANWLKDNFNVKAAVMYDRPPSLFLRSGLLLKGRHSILCKLELSDQELFPALLNWVGVPGGTSSQKNRWPNPLEKGQCEVTVQTYRDIPSDELESKPEDYFLNANLKDKIGIGYGNLRMRSDRAGIVVSSTSWTPDEDFSILLTAIKQFDARLVQAANALAARSSNGLLRSFPARVLFLITGKGLLRADFEKSVSELDPPLQLVAVRTLWLEPGDYPNVVALADVGISLHTSTSGLDLPMKVSPLSPSPHLFPLNTNVRKGVGHLSVLE